jgi:hypothetical protein
MPDPAPLVTRFAPSPNGRLHLGHAFQERRRRGRRRVLVEGGGGLVAQMFAWNAVDQVLAFVAPKINGGRFAPTPVAGEGRPFMAEAWRLVDVQHEVYGPDLAIRLDQPAGGGQLVINLRAEAAPEVLAEALRESLPAASASVEGLQMTLEHLEFFRPGKPVPTHRIGAFSE